MWGVPVSFQWSLGSALLVAVVVCVNADVLGRSFGVMAHPDHRRKHSHPTPQLGGVAILLGFIVWVLGVVLSGVTDQMMVTTALSSAGLGLVGFLDDQREISPILRMALLLLFLGIAFALNPALITTQLHWYSFGISHIPIWSYLPLMGLTGIGLVNAVNMADGQNGLVGGMFVVWTCCLMLVSTGMLQIMSGVLLCLSLVFLAFNLAGRVFLGDCGSYGVTFVIGLMVTMAHAQGRVALETVIVWFFIPVVDCLRLIVTRLWHRRGFFESDRDHFHHRLIDSMGKQVSATIYVLAIAISSLLATLEPRFSLVALCGLCAFYFTFARLSESSHREVAVKSFAQRVQSNVVSMETPKREAK